MLRRLGSRGDGGAGLAEYAGLVVLAALILGALVALGVPAKVESGVSSAICQIFQGTNCGKPEASGPNGGDRGGGNDNPGQNSGGQNAGGQDGNGDEPSLADLQKNADDAQKAADDANGKYGNIKQQIIDLLKDFIGITDIEECITKGSISSCLWAAFDVASWIFAALKIAKFAKAVKDAIKLYKVYNKGRKIIDRAKDAAKRAKDLLKKRRKACGLPVSYVHPNAPPRRVVHAALVGAGTVRITLAAAPAKPKGKCDVPDEKPPPKNTRTPAEKQQLARQIGYKKTNYRSHGQPVYEAPKGSRPKYLTVDKDAHNGGDFKGADSPEGLGSKSTRSGTYRYEDGKLVRVGD